MKGRDENDSCKICYTVITFPGFKLFLEKTTAV